MMHSTGSVAYQNQCALRLTNLLAMASNPIAMASNLIAMASNLIAMASNLLAMAPNLIAIASNLIATARGLDSDPSTSQAEDEFQSAGNDRVRSGHSHGRRRERSYGAPAGKHLVMGQARWNGILTRLHTQHSTARGFKVLYLFLRLWHWAVQVFLFFNAQ